MPQNPKLSVIIPVFKVEEYLHQCLDSVVNQTFYDIEIICVNDGSPDNCGDILDEYAAKDSRIKVLNQKNQGLSMARNNGAKIATGEYITYLDSDDWVALDFYERLYNLAKLHDADIAGGNVLNWHSESKTGRGHVSKRSFSVQNTVRKTLDERKELVYACACWNKIYRREFIEKHGLDFPAGKLVEDFPFTFMTTALANKIVMDPDTDLFYRQRDTSIMATNKFNRNAFDKIDNHLLIYELLNKSDLSNRDIYRQLNDVFLIEDCYLWLNSVHPDYKQELFDKYKKLVSGIDLRNNYFATRYTKNLAENVRRARKTSEINSKKRYFGGIIKIKINGDKKRVKIFGIPTWKERTSLKKTRYYLFGVRIFERNNNCKMCVRNFTPFNIDNSKLLSELKHIGKFVYMPNKGNLGDMMIAKATIDFFDANKLNYTFYKHGCKPDTIVYGGGGLWTKNYRDSWINLIALFNKAKKIVILPSSFWECQELLDSLDDRFVVFCREQRSFDYLSAAKTGAKIILDHDMALRMTPRALKVNRFAAKEYTDLIDRIDLYIKRSPRVVKLTRGDVESVGGYESDFDLSQQLLVLDNITKDKIEFACAIMLLTVDSFDAIITDRLHVAIAGLLMGKPVYMLDNSYGKLSSVYENSFKDNLLAHFCTRMPDVSEINPPHSATDNFKRLLGLIK